MTESARILFFDLETTDLDADFGNVLAFGYKWLGDKQAKVLSLLDTNEACKACGRLDAVDDKLLIQAAWPILAEADIWVTWFGKGFDWKVLNTRVLDGRMKPLPATPHIDLYFCARHNLKLSSNRLASVQDFLRLPTTKSPLTKRVWRQAQAGHVPSIKYIVDHCRRDVQVLDEAYAKLKPYVRQHPFVASPWDCRVCGSNRLQRRGLVIAGKKRKVRTQCTGCGAWATQEAA